MEIYLSGSSITFNGKQTPIANVIPSLEVGDIIILNHSTFGSVYNLSGIELVNVIPFEVVSKNQIEFTDQGKTGRPNVTLMSKNILRFAAFDFNGTIENLDIGTNYWEDSKLRSYLNSTSTETPDEIDDISYLYDDEQGFLNGFDNFIKNIIPQVKVKTALDETRENFSIGSKEKLKELNTLKNKYINQKNYNDTMLSIYKNKSSRNSLSGVIQKEIDDINSKKLACSNCITNINNAQTYLKNCKTSIYSSIANIGSGLSSTFNNLISSLDFVNKDYESTSVDNYTLFHDKLSSIFDDVNNLTSKVNNIESTLNNQLSTFKANDFLNYNLNNDIQSNYIKSILPNIKDETYVNSFTFNEFNHHNLENNKTKYNINIINDQLNIIDIMNNIFSVIYDVCLHINNDEYYFSNGKKSGFRPKIYEFVNLLEYDEQANEIFEDFKKITATEISSFAQTSNRSKIKYCMYSIYHSLRNNHYWRSYKKYYHCYTYYYIDKQIFHWGIDTRERVINLIKLLDDLYSYMKTAYNNFYKIALIYWSWYYSNGSIYGNHKRGKDYEFNFDGKSIEDFMKYYYIYYRRYLKNRYNTIFNNFVYYKTYIKYHWYIYKKEYKNIHIDTADFLTDCQLLYRFISILKKNKIDYHDLYYNRKLNVIFSDMINDEMFQEVFPNFTKISDLNKEFKKIVDKISNYNENTNQFKLLCLYLNDTNIYNQTKLFTELKDFSLNDYKKSVDIPLLINEFKTVFGHLNKLCNTYSRLYTCYQSNIKTEYFDKNEFLNFIKELCLSIVETKNYNEKFKILINNSYKEYEGFEFKEIFKILSSIIRKSLNDFIFHFYFELLSNKNNVKGINFNYENNIKSINYDPIYEIVQPLINIIDNRISNLEKMKDKLNDNIIKLNKELDAINLKLDKFKAISGYNGAANGISENKLLLSSNLFINEILYKPSIAKITFSSKTNKNGNILPKLTKEYNYLMYSVNHIDDFIDKSKNHEKYELYYFPPNVDLDTKINIPFKLENSSCTPSSTFINVEFPITGKIIDTNNIDYLSSFEFQNVPSTSLQFKYFDVSVTSGNNIIDHYTYYNDYLSGKISHIDCLISAYNEKYNNQINDHKISNDKIYIPSITELGFGDNNEIEEGTEFDIIASNSFNIKKLNLNCSYLTRSPNPTNRFELYEINEYGSLDFTSTTYHKNGLVVCLNLYVP